MDITHRPAHRAPARARGRRRRAEAMPSVAPKHAAAMGAVLLTTVAIIIVAVTGYALVEQANEERIHLKRQLVALRARCDVQEARVHTLQSQPAVEAWARKKGMVLAEDRCRYIGQGRMTVLAGSGSR